MAEQDDETTRLATLLQAAQEEIRRYAAAEEADLQLARHLLKFQTSAEGVQQRDDPAVQTWSRTSRKVGGDLLLMGRTPGGVLHVLLADAGSSGLSAYLSLQPMIAPFHRMTEKGFSLPTIVRELNRKLRQTLPPGRAVTAQMATVDNREGIVSVWNGGMPAAFMLDGLGRHVRAFRHSHPPLATADDRDFADGVETHACAPEDQLVLVSDGLLAASGGQGRFGERGLADALAGQPRSLRCKEVAASLDAHLDGGEADDDMTLVLVDCGKKAAAVSAPVVEPLRPGQSGNWSFSLRLDAGELRNVDVVPLLLGVIDQFPSARASSGELFVVLSELFNNALDHGLLQLESSVKHDPDGMETWLAMRSERLNSLREGEIHLWVEQLVEAGQRWLRIHCQDSGPGFDLQATLARSRERLAGAHPSTLPYGRGLALIESFAHSFEVNQSGNEVSVLLALDSRPVTAA